MSLHAWQLPDHSRKKTIFWLECAPWFLESDSTDASKTRVGFNYLHLCILLSSFQRCLLNAKKIHAKILHVSEIYNVTEHLRNAVAHAPIFVFLCFFPYFGPPFKYFLTALLLWCDVLMFFCTEQPTKDGPVSYPYSFDVRSSARFIAVTGCPSVFVYKDQMTFSIHLVRNRFSCPS